MAKRQSQEVANGTINRELAVLGKLFRLAYENGKLLRVPAIRKLKESAPRSSFFERDAYERCASTYAPISGVPSPSSTS